MNNNRDRKRIAFSVVSHAQGHLLAHLLEDLRRHVGETDEVIVTLNLPEPEGFLQLAQFPLRIIRNAEPMGFGANHNQAFKASHAEYFAVLNPDLRLPQFDLEQLLATFGESRIAAVSPVITRSDGAVEDNARRFPSPARIARRVARRWAGLANHSDYEVRAAPLTPVDWVAGMFIVFRSDDYQAVGGFDERYFMYLEDADICRRIGQAGRIVVVDGRTTAVHDAQRATLRQWRHLRWHLASMLRFFVDSLRLRLRAGR